MEARVKKGVAQAYDTIYAAKVRRLSELFQDKIEISLVKRYLNPGSVLDAGCGKGRVSLSIADDLHDVVGIDLSRKGIPRPKRLLSLELYLLPNPEVTNLGYRRT